MDILKGHRSSKSLSDMTNLLNDNHYEILKQLKQNIGDVKLPSYYTDTWLLKWLRAHSYNLRKTERLLRGTMRCRDLYKLDSIAQTYVKSEALNKYEYTSPLGIAKNGSPIRYTRIGSGDHVGLLMSVCGYDVCLYCTYVMEQDLENLRKENKRTGQKVSEVTYILDMEGLQITQMMYKSLIETALDLLQMLQDHYPEIWGNIFIINVPSFFDKIFNIFKPVLRMNLLQKIKVASRESTPLLLLKFIDKDVLPVFLGGEKVDSYNDPNCSEYVKFGGKFPEEYYLQNRIRLIMETEPNATGLWVPARSAFNYPVVIQNGLSRIRVEFRTENGSISLKLLFRDLGDESEKPDLPLCDEYLHESNSRCNVKFVSPSFRIQSHTTPVDVVHDAPWRGIYIFRFDNTFSWFTSKKLIFRIQELKDIS